MLSNAPSVGLEPDWEDSPFHFAQLLAPKLSVTGYADGCIYTRPGYLRQEPVKLRLYSYPATAPRARRARTSIFGFGGGTTAGKLSDTTLAGPDGRSRCASSTTTPPGSGVLLPPGGFLVPVSPLLEPTTRYTAQVDVHRGRRRARDQELELPHRRGRPGAEEPGRGHPAGALPGRARPDAAHAEAQPRPAAGARRRHPGGLTRPAAPWAGVRVKSSASASRLPVLHAHAAR